MKTRVISGAVLAVIMVSALIIGEWYLYLLCFGIALIGLYELYKIVDIHNNIMGFLGYFATIIYYICIKLEMEQFEIFLVVFAFIMIMTAYVITFPKYSVNQMMTAFVGIIYVSFMISYIYKIRMFDNGIYVIWLVFITSWVNDTFAYFTGVLFGKHKMVVKLSPKKTWEGAVGGVLMATIAGFAYGYLVSTKMTEVFVHPIYTFGIASFVGAILSIIGDLGASAIKRSYNIKDYGTLIPGHGGILDRFDSVIFTAPAVYFAIYLINTFM